MRGTRRLAAAGAFILAVSGGATVATTQPASAGGWGCTGTEVSGSPFPETNFYVNSPIYGYIHLYYDASTGYNCAVNVKTGSGYGVPTDTEIELEECAEDVPGTCTVINDQWDPPVTSTALYSYYAGPVRVYGKGHCISYYGLASAPDGTYGMAGNAQGSHC
jgi:hypothetical protein